MSTAVVGERLLTTKKCHSERSEESKEDSSPVGLRMTKWVAKQSRSGGVHPRLILAKKNCLIWHYLN